MTASTIPKLSFCIPTYNNANELKITLDSILSQLPNLDNFEIIISDNCSLDATQEIARDFCTRYPFIRYFRNRINLGVGRNIYNVLKNAQGEFLWLLGDDKLLSGAVSSVLNAIQNCKKVPSAIYVNWQSVWPTTYSGKRTYIDNQTNLKVPCDREVEGVDSYLDLRLPYLPVISAHIFNREFLDFGFLDEFMDCNWPQLYILFSALSKNPWSLHVSHICIEDNHIGKENRQISPDPWPSDIFTSQLVRIVFDQERLGFIREQDAHRVLQEMYDYIYCDTVTFREYLFTVRAATDDKTTVHRKLAYHYMSASMGKNQGFSQRAFVWFFTKTKLDSLAISLVYIVATVFILFKRKDADESHIVIVSPREYKEALKAAIALNAVGIKPILITGNDTLLTNNLFERVFLCDSIFQIFYCMAKRYTNRSFHVFASQGFILIASMILFKLGKIYIDMTDTIGLSLNTRGIKKYILWAKLKEWCMSRSEGVIYKQMPTDEQLKINCAHPNYILVENYGNYMLQSNIEKN